VSLEAVLAAREDRARLQAELLEAHPLPVLSLGVVCPGAVKDGPGPRAAFMAALGALEDLARERGWTCRGGHARYLPTGPEAVLSVDAPAEDLKRALVALEDGHPLGRLWDLDVRDPAGPLSRSRLGLPPRKCLVCPEPAHACARSRAHAPEALDRAVRDLLHAGGLRLS
jgi:holo-ACP synthase